MKKINCLPYPELRPSYAPRKRDLFLRLCFERSSITVDKLQYLCSRHEIMQLARRRLMEGQ